MHGIEYGITFAERVASRQETQNPEDLAHSYSKMQLPVYFFLISISRSVYIVFTNERTRLALFAAGWTRNDNVHVQLSKNNQTLLAVTSYPFKAISNHARVVIERKIHTELPTWIHFLPPFTHLLLLLRLQPLSPQIMWCGVLPSPTQTQTQRREHAIEFVLGMP